MKDSDKELIKQTGIVAIDTAIAGISISNPEIGISLGICRGLAQALYGNAIKLRQNKALEFIELIKTNPGIFTKELMDTEEFQDGFIYTLEQYIRERNRKKRLIVQKIFLGFATDQEKELFNLEKYLQTLSNMSSFGLEYLYFIKENILPIYEKEVNRRASEIINQKGTDKDLDFRKKIYKRDLSISEFILKRISDNYSPNSEQVIKKYSLDLISDKPKDKIKIDKCHEMEEIERNKYNIAIPELLSLGFLSMNDNNFGTLGGGSIRYNMTNFLEEFLEFIPK